MEIVADVIKQAPDWLLAISGIITALTAFTALTPSKIDDKTLGVASKYVNIALKVLNVGAGNVLSNKNKK